MSDDQALEQRLMGSPQLADFKCPISNAVMRDPVKASDGCALPAVRLCRRRD